MKKSFSILLFTISIDNTVSADVYISSVDATLGTVDKIENIKTVFVNPFTQGQGTDIKLVQFAKCVK